MRSVHPPREIAAGEVDVGVQHLFSLAKMTRRQEQVTRRRPNDRETSFCLYLSCTAVLKFFLHSVLARTIPPSRCGGDGVWGIAGVLGLRM